MLCSSPWREKGLSQEDEMKRREFIDLPTLGCKMKAFEGGNGRTPTPFGEHVGSSSLT
jgi:hypothetical protein